MAFCDHISVGGQPIKVIPFCSHDDCISCKTAMLSDGVYYVNPKVYEDLKKASGPDEIELIMSSLKVVIDLGDYDLTVLGHKDYSMRSLSCNSSSK